MKQKEIITQYLLRKSIFWIKVMKITMFFFFFGMTSIMAEGLFSQEKKLTLKVEEITINSLITKIEKESD